MSDEEKKKEEKEVKGCGDCLNENGENGPFRKLFGVSLFGVTFGFCLCVLLCVVVFPREEGGGSAIVYALAVIVTLAFATVYFLTNVVGRYLYGFYPKDEKWHLHAKSVPYVVTKMYASGPTKDFCDRDYYYIPSNMAGSKEELFSKFGIDRPILRIPDGGWFKSYAILSSGTTRYNDWSIDRARLIDGTVTVRLRYKLRDATAMIVTPEEAIRIIETCNDQVGTKSLATCLLDEMEHRKVMLGYANSDMNAYADVAKKWKKQAVDGWSRVNAMYEVLARLEKALEASKKVSKSRIIADARVAVSEIMGSNLLHHGDEAERDIICGAIQDAGTPTVTPVNVLINEFDQSIAAKDVPMLKVLPACDSAVQQA